MRRLLAGQSEELLLETSTPVAGIVSHRKNCRLNQNQGDSILRSSKHQGQISRAGIPKDVLGAVQAAQQIKY